MPGQGLTILNELQKYNAVIDKDEQDVAGQLNSLTESGKTISLADMMKTTFAINNLSAKVTISYTTMSNMYKLINAIAQRAPVAG